MTGQALHHIEKLRSLEGCTRREAAAALGLCEPYVIHLAKTAGITLSKNNGRSQSDIDDLKALAASGFTRQEAAKELGRSASYVNVAATRYGIKFLRAGLQLEATARTRQMAALYKAGKTLQEIGDQYGITRERVRQLITKFHNLRAQDGGKAKTAADRRAKMEATRNARSLKKWGCSFEQYVAIRAMKKPTRAYSTQCKNAAKRGVAWELNLWEWWCIWHQSGKWEQRGRGNKYMMCRFGGVGPYAVDNVYIATGCENSSREHAKISGLPRGVSCKRGRYLASRCLGGKRRYLGSYPTPELAHAAYLAGEGLAQ